MMWGTLCAFIIISSLITLITRSLTFGSISLIANTLPALAAFGIWGLTVAEIGMATSTVVCIAIGIIVDDTVHFIEQYRNARVIQGMSSEDAIRYAYSHAGLAIFVTSIVLAAGFLILGGSPFSATADTGNLIALTITAALLFDLFMVPAVIYLLDRKRVAKHAVEQSANHTDAAQELPA